MRMGEGWRLGVEELTAKPQRSQRERGGGPDGGKIGNHGTHGRKRGRRLAVEELTAETELMGKKNVELNRR